MRDGRPWFSYEIGYLNKEDYDVMDLHYNRTIKTLRALMNFIEKTKRSKV